MKKIIFEGILTGAEILEMNPNLTGLELEVSYSYIQGEKMFGNKIECEISTIRTEQELAIQLYEAEKQIALTDLKELDNLILLGMKTEQDKLNRQQIWLQYDSENNPY
jgi:hypothetical protein